MKYTIGLGIFIITGILTKCSPAPLQTKLPLISQYPDPPLASISLLSPSISPIIYTTSSPEIIQTQRLETLESPSVTDTPVLLPTATNHMIPKFYPTVIPAMGAEYRPPLYPIPWAVSPYDHFYFAAPIAATYPGDPIWDYRYGGTYFGPDVIHSGVDLPAPRGAEILAVGPGTVVWAGIGLYSGSSYNLEDPYGIAVAIRHDFGYKGQPLFSVYAHMEELDVVLGQWVDTGEVLGNVGDTGMTTGPHLHFEIRLGENDFWKTRNPELWVSPPQGEGVLVGRVLSTYGQRLDSYLVMLKSLETGHQYSVNTYAALTVNSDTYYNENVVLGELPAGLYELNIPYGALNRKANIQILPGRIMYFSFFGFSGYDFSPPPSTETGQP